MKNLLILIVFLRVLPLPGQDTQEKVLFDHVIVHGGFGGPFAELSSIDGETGILGGGGGGVILNDFFIGGFGLGCDFASHTVDSKEYPMTFGYGGLWLGFVKPSTRAVHFFGDLKIGGGSISINSQDDQNGNELFKESVFVVQPGAGVEVNLFKWFRVALTANYRLVSGIKSPNQVDLHNRDFNTAGMVMTFRFGKFYKNR